MNLFEMFEQGPPKPTLIDALRDFLPIAVKHLQLDHIPKIKLVKEIENTRQPTFGRFVNDDKVVYVVVKNRHPVDVLRTLAHELVHYQQGEEHRLDADSWHTGSPIEDEANAEGGVIMRLFNQAHPRWMALEPIAIQESLGKSSLVAALAAALAMSPAPASADEPSPAAQALGIYRKINKMQHYGQEGLESEARQELINILQSIQGKPNQSKILPIIKKMITSDDNNGTAPTNAEDLPPMTLPDDAVQENFVNSNNLTEAFDTPYSLTWEHNPGESHDAWTKLPDGTTLSIMVSRDYGVMPDPDDWAVEFYRDNTQDVTGQGDAQRIFATVLAAIKEVIELEQPLSISFAASKETDTGDENLSRANLYTRLVQRYAASWGYRVKVSDLRGTTAYRLDKITNENFADGKKPGRKGLAKRVGVNTKASVSDLRKTAKNSSGEKQRMAHWLANMKSGRNK